MTESTRNRRFSNQPRSWLSYVGDCSAMAEYLAKKRYNSAWGVAKFLNALFRGYGHVVFSNNPISGILIMVATFWANPVAGAAGLLSTTIGLLVSIMFKFPKEQTDSGLSIFNNVLHGTVSGNVLTAKYGVHFETVHWMILCVTAVFCAFCSSAVTSFLGNFKQRLICLAVPFNFVQFIFFTLVPVLFQNSPSVEISNSTGVLLPAPTFLTSQSLGPFDLRNITLPKSETQFPSSIHSPLSIDNNQDSRTMDFSDIRNFTLTNNEIEFVNSSPSNEKSKDNMKLDPIMRNFMLSINETESPSEVLSSLPLNENISTTTFLYSVDLRNATFLKNSTEFVSPVPYLHSTESIQEYTNTVEEEMELQAEITTINTTLEDASTTVESTQASSVKNDTSLSEDEIDKNTKDITTEETLLRQKRNSNEELKISEKSHHNTTLRLDWGLVFTGVILSMTNVFGLAHVPAALLMYLGVLICSPITAAFCLAGSFLSTITGIFLSDTSYDLVYEGAWGFNGLLSAAALGGFCWVVTWQSTVVALICSVFTTVLQAALMGALDAHNLPVMSLPFNLATLLFLCIAADSSRLPLPDALTFPEKHLHQFQQQKQQLQKKSSPLVTSGKYQKEQEAQEKMAPLAEPEEV